MLDLCDYYCTWNSRKNKMPMYDAGKVMRTSSQLTRITAKKVRRPM
jgi:hypothetical protein